MKYIRPFDESATFDTGFPGYRAQIVSNQESALIIGSWIGAGGCGPGLHYHDSDQSYYLARGEMNVRLGTEVHHVEAGSFVFIPAGLAHRNWNDGSEPEFHFEMIVPAPGPGKPLMYPVDSPDQAPGSAEAGYVRKVTDAEFTPAGGFDGMAVLPVGSNDRAVYNAIRMAPGGAGPETHIHEFDQYYFVLEGTLEVEVALQRHSVAAGAAVLLPAGVPHRQWNEGPEHTLHLALLSPAPVADEPWDRGVVFSASGADHSG